MPQGPLRIQWIYQNAPRKNWFQLILGAAALVLLLFFGVWLFMIAATLLVILLPYFWWKKRKFIEKMTRMQQDYAKAAGGYSTDQAPSSSQGVTIEGEVIAGDIVDDKKGQSSRL